MANDLSDVLTTGEIVKMARERVDQNAWDFLIGGAETETTTRRNRLAIDSLAFRPRVLRNVKDIDSSADILGLHQRIPVLLAPMGAIVNYDAEGAVAVARAASAFGITQIVSSVCGSDLDEVRAAAGDATQILQLYTHGDQAWLEERLEMVKRLKFSALCLTVDTSYYGRRERDIMKGFLPAGRGAATGAGSQPELDWDTVAWIMDRLDIPIILKGIATAEDAALAVKMGVELVYVSNHGGRQLDHGRGALDVLGEIVSAVDGRAQIIIDGGFLRGGDVIKAICLGADAVAMGRLYGYGLAAGGEAGVTRVLEILESEVVNTMGLLGATALDQLGPEFLHAAPPIGPATATSAFPLIDLPGFKY